MITNKNKRNNISSPEGSSLQELLNKIQKLQQIHAQGSTYYDTSAEWKKRSYGWHNPLFPPEYRRCCLNGEPFISNPSCDLYYLMAYYYESITECKAPYNFELDRSWKTHITANSTLQDPVVQTAVTEILAGCTKWKHRKRIQNAESLLQTDSVKILKASFFS